MKCQLQTKQLLPTSNGFPRSFVVYFSVSPIDVVHVRTMSKQRWKQIDISVSELRSRFFNNKKKYLFFFPNLGLLFQIKSDRFIFRVIW